MANKCQRKKINKQLGKEIQSEDRKSIQILIVLLFNSHKFRHRYLI